MAELTIVRFVEHWPPYAANETAGFDPAAARELVARGIAVVDLASLPANERRRAQVAAAEQYLRKAALQ